MGTSTNAILLYGYHLGSDESWELEGAGEYGELPPLDWFNPDDQDEGGPDFIEAAKVRLLTQVAGFTEADWHADGYYDRQRAAEKRLGVGFESHCSGDFPEWVLCAGQITAYRGDVHEIDPARLAAEPNENGWDAKLAAALQALVIRPKQQKPAWLLCSYWG